MQNDNKYSIHIYWSDTEEQFVAICQEQPYLSCFYDTRKECLDYMEWTLNDKCDKEYIPIESDKAIQFEHGIMKVMSGAECIVKENENEQ